MSFVQSDFLVCPVCGLPTKITSTYDPEESIIREQDWLHCSADGLHADAINFAGEATHFCISEAGDVWLPGDWIYLRSFLAELNEPPTPAFWDCSTGKWYPEDYFYTGKLNLKAYAEILERLITLKQVLLFA
jgi:hypothetical protein